MIRRTPPLGTVWVYTVARLHLAGAVAALGIVGAFVKLTGLKLDVFGQ